jgi:hypothetical protein
MLLTMKEVVKEIERGRFLSIAGDEGFLSKLPKGNWIAGTIPYFMAEEGGVITKDKAFVHDLTDMTQGATIKSYELDDLPKLNEDAPEHGFTMLIIPSTSQAHVSYGHDAPGYPGFFMKPIVGWISGVHLDDYGKTTPKVFNGSSGNMSDKKAIAMHCPIAKSKDAVVSILNLFKQGNGDTIRFEGDGFDVKNCLVNGTKLNFAEYLVEKKIDTKLPLVADYNGAMVNVSFQSVDESKGLVSLYGPVFQGINYKIAAPVGDYVAAFREAMPKDVSPTFVCNCVLNFLYSELEGRVTDNLFGPATFGEIAYQLLNQTLVYLEVK